MASSLSIILTFSLLLTVSSSLPLHTQKLGGHMVGGITPIPNVATDKEVQKLGRFSVSEHNNNFRLDNPIYPATLLSFVRVVEARSQVVAGIKYYLKIAATAKGKPAKFDAEVVVRAWEKSTTLISFTPAKPEK